MLQTKSSIGEDYGCPDQRYADETQSAEQRVARVHHIHGYYVVYIYTNRQHSMLKISKVLSRSGIEEKRIRLGVSGGVTEGVFSFRNEEVDFLIYL